ncbi:uncharacterized protein LOC130672821 [Microplitis mediator]|uniref:uncharacterized protein LOC130672821 n=1 Tax=Microplitis mediator TaxID=375433 RepID=UPI0025530836|nr:uncharacterized protein LOC130672821 [Microplitis mediator]
MSTAITLEELADAQKQDLELQQLPQQTIALQLRRINFDNGLALYSDIASESWYDALPAVLLSLRAAWKDDIQTTPAELVYGEPIRLPGELLTPSNKTTPHDIVNTLKRHFNSLAPAKMSRHGKHSIYCFRNLSTCSHVLVRNDQVGLSFSPPYEGPYRVITRHDKYFIVDFRGRQIAISVDRLKLVYEANPVDTATMITNSQPINTATETQKTLSLV